MQITIRTLSTVALWLAILDPIFAAGAEPSSPRIKWQTSLEAAVATAGELRRPIVVFIQSRDCGFCEKMRRETWNDRAVSSLVDGEFVALQLSLEEHAGLVEKLGVSAFPTTLIATPEGKLIRSLRGHAPPKTLLPALRHAVEVVHPVSHLE